MRIGNIVIATSDDHTCRPGLTLTSENFTTKGGYTGVYAESLSKEALWEAFWSRRTYGTTGERIIVDFKVDEHMMGEEYEAERAPVISVKVNGTKPLHAVEVMRGTETIYRHPFAAPAGENRLIKVEWMGARVKSRPKRVNWWTATKPPRLARSSTTTCPLKVAALAMITWLPSWQSWAMWVYAMSMP